MMAYAQPQQWKKVQGYEEREIRSSLLILNFEEGKL